MTQAARETPGAERARESNTDNRPSLRGRLNARGVRRRAPSWREVAQSLFFIVESIDDYLHTYEQFADESVRTIYSGPTRAKLMGGDTPQGRDPFTEWAQMVEPEDKATHEAHRERLSRGEPSDVIYRLRGYDGVTRWLHARERPRHTDGRVLVDGIVSDVTRRIDADTALAEAEQNLRNQLSLNQFQANHDQLTGLGNRRRLLADLETLAAEATEASPLMLVILDLDGFKRYNDTYGHPAGDTLLARLGKKLAIAAGPEAGCYRLGGDEFCVLYQGSKEDGGAVLEAASGALAERGEGFAIDCSFGVAAMPSETSDPAEALQIADERLYGQKRARLGHRDAAHHALLQALYERAPGLRDHAVSVARLAQATGARLGLEADTLEHVMQAAQLHDIGMIAVPDTILEKPGPLTAEERTSVELHTVIGERILAASPALRPVARIVRAHHERWDGTGYPDNLIGDQCPIEARIVAVCDAFSALTSARPDRDARTPSEALEEIRKLSATQFDPNVVHALAVALIDLAQSPVYAERRAS